MKKAFDLLTIVLLVMAIVMFSSLLIAVSVDLYGWWSLLIIPGYLVCGLILGFVFFLGLDMITYFSQHHTINGYWKHITTIKKIL